MPSRLARWTLSRARRMASDNSLLHSDTADYYSFTALPNELLFAVLEVMEDGSLHIMAAVSKRFYHLATQALLSRYGILLASGHVTIGSSDALRALRIAMTLYRGTFKQLSYLVPSEKPLTKDVRRLEALLKRFWGALARIRSVSLDFGTSLIERPVGWRIGGLAPRLLYTICGDSQAAVFVVDDGLFTCKPKSMLLWNPYTREKYSKLSMHDGTRQWVPSIRSIKSLDITYPVCTALSPTQPWTLVVVDAASITTLLFSIQLSPEEWSAILSSITLPHLTEVGIWAANITSAASTAFLNRHADAICTLKYMSPVAESLPAASAPLSLPKLHHLSARTHYVVRILRDRDSDTLFPALTFVELWPDTHTHAALQRLSARPSLTHLALWLLTAEDFAAAPWPMFPAVEHVELNKSQVEAARLPALLAKAFPALRRLRMSHCFPAAKVRSPAEDRAIHQSKRAVVRRIAQANPLIERYYIDEEFFEP